MRNLKKILALVLALVMSLSLMATAGAAEATAADSTDPYATAKDVLTGVNVFRGYTDGEMNWDTPITRVQTAALVYRINTGDVTDAKTALHTEHPFKDVAASYWGTPYISYGYNAGILKGMGGNNFAPDANVTGYQTLAMILRAMGYGRNGEFEGDGWEVRTASTAQSLGLLKNVSPADSSNERLSKNASRGLVAEILFRALFTEKVKYSALNPYNYDGIGEYLADNLKLEEVEGIVIANEYADLYDTDTLPDGKTQLRGKKDYTLDHTTDLNDIGEKKLVYVQNGSKVIKFIDQGEYPETYDKTTLSDFNKANNLTVNGSTEQYINFGPSTNWTSDWKIKYVVDIGGITKDSDAVPSYIELDRAIAEAIGYYRTLGYTFNLPFSYLDDSGEPQYKLVRDGNNGTDEWYWMLTYTVEFRINEDITPYHQQNIIEIFNVADRLGTPDWNYWVDGEVYVGTTSMKDISDEKSLEQFKNDYIKTDDEDLISGNENGNWLKVIDNNGDGVAEYVFKTIYTVAQVANKRDDTVTLDAKDHVLLFNSMENVNAYKACGIDFVNTLTSQPVVSADTLEKGSVVYYAVIDGKAQTYLAEELKAVKIEKVDHNKLIAYTTDGAEYTQAGVHEHIEDEAYMHFVRNLAGNVNYDLYLVNGYLAAFVKTDTIGQFQLITDAWFNQLKTNKEYAVRVYDDEAKKTRDIDVSTNANLFIFDSSNSVSVVQNNNWGALKYFGGSWDGSRFWTDNSTNYYAELNGRGNGVHTIVAAVDEENGIIVPVENSSVTGRYQHNMIDITSGKVPTKAAVKGDVYITRESSLTKTAYNEKLPNVVDNNGNIVTKYQDVEVRALNTTKYYVVAPDANGNAQVVVAAVGYDNAPDTSKLNVEDIYAVGTLHEPDNNLTRNNYYLADVVVVEVSSYEDLGELIFVLNDNARYSDVRFRELDVIRKDGTRETVTVDFSGYNGGYWDNLDNHKKIMPGLYYLLETATEGVYNLVGGSGERDRYSNASESTPLDPDVIRKTGKIAAGQVDLVDHIGGYNYLVTRNWTTTNTLNGNVANGWYLDENGIRVGLEKNNYSAVQMGMDGTDENPAATTEGRYAIPADAKLYVVSYGKDWRYDTVSVTERTGAEWDEVLQAIKNDTTNPYNTNREDSKTVHQNLTWFNYNDVMVCYDKEKLVYAISFENLTTGDQDNSAQDIWLRTIPSAAAKDEENVIFGKFYGVEFGLKSDKPYVEAPYQTASTATSASGTVHYGDVKGNDTGLTYWKDGEVYATDDRAPMVVPTAGLGPIKVTVTWKDTEYTFTLTLTEAHDDKLLSAVPGVLDINDGVTPKTFAVAAGYRDRISQFVQDVRNGNRDLENNKHAVIDFVFFNNRNGSNVITDWAGTSIGGTSDEVNNAVIVVRPEDGSAPEYYYMNGAPEKPVVIVDSKENIAVDENGNKIEVNIEQNAGGDYIVTVKAAPGVTPVVVIGNKVYAMTKEAPMAKSIDTTGWITWTCTVTVDMLNGETVIYVRAEVKKDEGEKVETDKPSTSTDITVTEEGKDKVALVDGVVTIAKDQEPTVAELIAWLDNPGTIQVIDKETEAVIAGDVKVDPEKHVILVTPEDTTAAAKKYDLKKATEDLTTYTVTVNYDEADTNIVSAKAEPAENLADKAAYKVTVVVKNGYIAAIDGTDMTADETANTEDAENWTYTYDGAIAGKSVEHTITARDGKAPAKQIEVTPTFTVTADLTDVKINDKAATTGTAAKVDAGKAITVTAKPGSSAKAYMVAEAAAATDDAMTIYPFTKGTDGTWTVTLPAATKNVAYKFYTVAEGLNIKDGWNATTMGTKPATVVTSFAESTAWFSMANGDGNARVTVAGLGDYMFVVKDGTVYPVTITSATTKLGGTVDISLRLQAYMASGKDGLGILKATVDGKPFTLNLEDTATIKTVTLNGKYYTEGKTGAEVTVNVSGNYFTIGDGTNTSIESDGTLGTSTSGKIALSGKTSITFKIGSADVAVEDGFYKYTLDDDAAAYAKAGDPITKTAAGNWFTVVDKDSKYVDLADVDAAHGTDVVALAVKDYKDGSNIKFAMPAFDITVKTNLYKVTVKGTDLPVGFTVDGWTSQTETTTKYVVGTAQLIAGDASTNKVLVTKADGTETLYTSNTQAKVTPADTGDCTIEVANNFKTVTVKTSKTDAAGTAKNVKGDIDWSVILKDLDEESYVTVLVAAAGNYYKLNDAKTALEDSTAKTPVYIAVKDLIAIKADSTTASGAIVDANFFKLSLDASALGTDGATKVKVSVEGAEKDAATITAGVYVRRGDTLKVEAVNGGEFTWMGTALSYTGTTSKQFVVYQLSDVTIVLTAE